MSRSLPSALEQRSSDAFGPGWPPTRQLTLSSQFRVASVLGDSDLVAVILTSFPRRPVHGWAGLACTCRFIHTEASRLALRRQRRWRHRRDRTEGALTEERLAEFLEAFRMLVEPNEPQERIRDVSLGILIRSLGYCLTAEEVEEMLDEVDPAGAGHVDFSSFCRLMEPFMSDATISTSLEDEFLDYADERGYMTTDDVRQLLRDSGESFCEEEVLEILETAQPDHLGRIDYHGFYAMMMAN
mmetsp:Transcript_52615/g.87363  ORF Transcript_52615/g.87363 Transcript_52615/m.87363 type:complete len:242 (-) Transcript_52615:105-830(-)|eukprot:CAMPEP_0119326510 /NCGR_PEP_ID=MMETSP1333-20130426/68591_1 /TAXON_ID=418940 /ORGANISM="Scyphosphaera apsteinii, Strain RCC1455" /LENGTH=241 /DNA_ID=CAMNT_0007334837 /DNA_START=60 /DNA_END=785 /DNA_ORIENTATION=-